MNARLIVTNFSSARGEFDISQWPVTIGRARDTSVRLDDCWVSRHHCQLDESHGALVVRDLGSKHGTWVNGQRVVESPFLPGDELSVGLEKLRAEYETDEVAACD